MRAKTPIVICEGGSRSSKSYSIAQYLVKKLLTENNKRILVSRKTLPALRGTAMETIINMLKQLGVYDKNSHNKTDRVYRYGSNLMAFHSIDVADKIRSFEWNYAWLEETTEYVFDDYMQVYLRMSAPTPKDEPNQMFLSYNPSLGEFWVYDLIGREDVTYIHSTFMDNPFLSDAYVRSLVLTRKYNPDYWDVFGLGKRKAHQGLVYTNWKVIPDAEFPGLPDDSIWGLDFGINDPTVLLHVVFLNGEVYVDEVFYGEGYTNKRLIKIMKPAVPLRDAIYADSAEKNRIEEIADEGFNIYPADKSVLDGIDYLKGFTLNITYRSHNLQREIQKYSWQKNRNDKYIDAVVKHDDHTMDAMRYGIYTHGRRYGIRPPRMKGLEKKEPRTGRREEFFRGY